MGKGKKNKNKNTDVVEEVAKDQPQDQAPEPDSVKESAEQASEPTQQSLPEQSQVKSQEKTEQPSQTAVNEAEKQSKKQEVQAPEEKNDTQSKNEQKEIPSQQQTQQNKEKEEKVESQQKPVAIEQVPQTTKQVVQEPVKQEKKTEQTQPEKVQTKPEEEEKSENKLQPVLSEPVIIKQEVTEPKSQPIEVLSVDPVPGSPREQKVGEKKEEPTNVQQPQAQPEQIKPQPQPQLAYRHELQDGLHMVAQVMDQLVFQNPLAHEQQSHGNQQFAQNFDPAAYHLIERIMQQQNKQKTPERDGSRSNTPPKKTEQVLQQIKQSAESIDPDPLQLQTIIQDPQKAVSILKSMHSDSDQQQNKKKRRLSEQSGGSKRASILLPPENPTYTNPIPPVPQVENPKPNEIISSKAIEKPKNQLDFQQINKEMLKQREIEWQKMQQRALQPKLAPPEIMSPVPLHQINVPPATPNAPEKLQYTNNLPIISELRNKDEKEKLKNEASEIKQKIQENDKLRKQINTDNPSKKIGIAAAISAACLCACVLGKADKKIAAGASIGAFLLGYLIQK